LAVAGAGSGWTVNRAYPKRTIIESYSRWTNLVAEAYAQPSLQLLGLSHFGRVVQLKLGKTFLSSSTELNSFEPGFYSSIEHRQRT
jgi:hypothetical protein